VASRDTEKWNFFSDDEYKIISSCQKRPAYVDSSPSVLVRQRPISPASRRPSLPMTSTVIYYSTWKGGSFRRIEIFRESLGRERGGDFESPRVARRVWIYAISISSRPTAVIKKNHCHFLSFLPSDSVKNDSASTFYLFLRTNQLTHQKHWSSLTIQTCNKIIAIKNCKVRKFNIQL